MLDKEGYKQSKKYKTSQTWAAEIWWKYNQMAGVLGFICCDDLQQQFTKQNWQAQLSESSVQKLCKGVKRLQYYWDFMNKIKVKI